MDVLDDLKMAVRSLWRSPAFAAGTLATLALGVGANVAVFSVANAVWLRPAPVSAPERLAVIGKRAFWQGREGAVRESFTRAAIDPVRAACAGCEAVVVETRPHPRKQELRAWLPDGRSMAVAGVSWNYFQALGVPIWGRPFALGEDEAGAVPVAIVSRGVWQSVFGSDPTILGRKVTIGRASFTIVGVAPAGFRGPGVTDAGELWVPLNAVAYLDRNVPPHVVLRDPDMFFHVRMFARFRPNTPAAVIETQIRSADRDYFVRTFEQSAYPLWAQEKAALDRQLIWMLAAAAGLVLLVTVANLSALLIARADRRRRELAIYTALGIPPRRLRRMLTLEVAVLCPVAAGAAVLVSKFLLNTLHDFALPAGLEMSALTLETDVRVAAFVSIIVLVVAVVATLMPTRRLSALRTSAILAGADVDDRSVVAGTRGLLLTVHVGATVVLLVGAGLLHRSVYEASRLDLAFDRNHVVFVRVEPNAARYAVADFRDLDLELRRRDRDRLKSDLRALPGVTAVTEGGSPLKPARTAGDRATAIAVVVGGAPVIFRGGSPEMAAGPGFCTTLGVKLLEGRDLHDGDLAPGAPRAAIIGRSMAKRLWPGAPSVGRRFLTRDEACQVVGVVEDAVRFGFRSSAAPSLYLADRRDPETELYRSGIELLVRTAPPADRLVAALSRVTRDVYPDAYRLDIATPASMIAAEMREARFAATLLTWFGTIASALAATGVWGLTSFIVQRRSRETGVRIALGASPWLAARPVVTRALLPVAIGCISGVVAAACGVRLLRAYLFGIGALDPVTFAAASALMVAVGLAASGQALRRILTVTPCRVLHEP